MKNSYMLLLCLLYMNYVQAQDKWNNIWILGYLPNNQEAGYGGTMLDFSAGPPQVSFFPIGMDAAANGTAQICNENGDFMFFSNGCKISSASGPLIENGDSINPGTLHDLWCNSVGSKSYETRQAPIALPWPGRPGEYAMFHLGWYQTTTWPPRRYLRDFYITQVDMNANNGLGKVLEKNTLLLQDSNLVDNLTAVRHGNGRDWWLVEPRGLTDSFFLFLFTPYGIQGPFVQETDIRSKSIGYTAGQAVFSPDGTKYAWANYRDGVIIFDFDRCEGRFDFGQRLPFPGDEDDVAIGAAISPSSRYLYVSALTKLFQYDLQADDIQASKTLIGEYDGFIDTMTSGLHTAFYQQMLAPNGKICISTPSSTHYLHVIHQPDSIGIACDFRQHDLHLAARHGFCVPNFPYFRLYDVPGSSCDTLGINAVTEAAIPSDGIRLFPNPIGTGTVHVTIPPCDGGLLQVFNTAGQYLAEYRIEKERLYPLDCSEWPNGVYVVTFSTAESRRPMVARLVVCR